MVKNLPENAGNTDLIPELEKSPGEGDGNLLQYYCLGNPMNRGAWWGYSPWGRKRVGHDLVTKQQQQISTLNMQKIKQAFLM